MTAFTLREPVAEKADVVLEQHCAQLGERPLGRVVERPEDVERPKDLVSFQDGQRQEVGGVVNGAFDVLRGFLELLFAQESGQDEDVRVFDGEAGDEQLRALPLDDLHGAPNRDALASGRAAWLAGVASGTVRCARGAACRFATGDVSGLCGASVGIVVWVFLFLSRVGVGVFERVLLVLVVVVLFQVGSAVPVFARVLLPLRRGQGVPFRRVLALEWESGTDGIR